MRWRVLADGSRYLTEEPAVVFIQLGEALARVLPRPNGEWMWMVPRPNTVIIGGADSADEATAAAEQILGVGPAPVDDPDGAGGPDPHGY